jgi:hypothetical protein
MKKFFCTTLLTVLIASAATAGRQDYPEEYLGLPGDNLNLYAVMKLFQESETLEAFERSLNEENSRINNLDLNSDGYVDYITVSDYVNGEDHTIVLRSVLDRNESQDVAVFTVEKLRNGEVMIQLIGDEALYGRNYIVEPIYAETPNPGYRGRTVARDNVTVVTTTYYEVASWPVISFIYSPRYIVWRSSWYWGYYPVYWNPWRPFYWHQYYGYHYHWYPHYYSCYRHWDHPRWNHYNDYYYKSVRAYSPNVSHRITAGTYKATYSRPETRRDGEALYASTQGNRSNSARPAAGGNDRRGTAASGSRSSSGQAAVQNGETRRAATGTVRSTPASNGRSSTAPGRVDSNNRSSSSNGRSSTAPGSVNRSTNPASSNGQEAARRTTSTEQRSQSTVQRSTQTSASRSQGTVQRSTQTSASRSQGTVQRSTQTSASRSQGAVQKSSQPPASRSQSTVQRAPSSRQSVSQKSSPSASQRSSAPAARSQSRSSSQGRSSSAPSQGKSSKSNSKSSSKSSSKNSDDSRSSRR